MTSREELLEKLRRVEVKDGRAKYGKELREEILKYSAPRVAAGVSQASIAAELGIKGWTLQRWHQNARRENGPVTKKPSFIRLEPAPEVGGHLEVVARHGRVVRVPVGFDEATLARVLVALERQAP